jgi:hypothetical protein
MLNVSYNCYSLQSERKETPDLGPQRRILKGHTSCCFIIPESVEAVSSPWMCARCDAQDERSVWPILLRLVGCLLAHSRHALDTPSALMISSLLRCCIRSVASLECCLSVERWGAVYYYYYLLVVVVVVYIFSISLIQFLFIVLLHVSK